MIINLERKDLTNTQQMEVAVNGPDGATHLIICTGIAELVSVDYGTFVFLVGPQILRRQFVGATASGAVSSIQAQNNNNRDNAKDDTTETRLASMTAQFDDESGQVKVTAEILSTIPTIKLAISYYVNILAELPIH